MKTKSSKRLKTKKQRLRLWPLTLVFKRGNWRAKPVTIEINKFSSYVLTFRTFKSSSKQRSKTKAQKIYSFKALEIKEIAIWHKTKKRDKKALVRQNHLKKSGSYSLVLTGLIGISMFGWQITNMLTKKPPVVMAQSLSSDGLINEVRDVTESFDMPRSIPTNLTIDSVGISSTVISLGQLADGTIETPDVFSNQVGWYTNSPTPGENGPSILLGHVDNLNGASVFWRLGEVKIGDVIKVARQDGTTAEFKVSGVEQFEQDNFPTEKVYGNTEDPEIRLITCGGTFNQLTQRYSKNTVVFGIIVE